MITPSVIFDSFVFQNEQNRAEFNFNYSCRFTVFTKLNGTTFRLADF